MKSKDIKSVWTDPPTKLWQPKCLDFEICPLLLKCELWAPLWSLFEIHQDHAKSHQFRSPYDGLFDHYNLLSHMDKLLLILFELAVLV